MNDKVDKSSVKVLRARQNDLTEKVKLLSGESRRLREEIKKAEATKGEVAANNSKINSEMRELERLKKDIQGELTKLANEASALNPTANASLSVGIPTTPLVPPPPPLIFKAATKKFTVSSQPKPPPKASVRDVTGDMLSQLSAGVQLKKSTENAKPKTEDELVQERENEFRRFESSIKTKEAEVERLLNQVSELATKLETEKASQVEYQKALESQVDAITELSKKKGALEGKLKEVKEKVGTELSKIEERKAQELAEKERLTKEQNTLILDNPVDNIPDVPPPPPPMGIPTPPSIGIPPPPPMGNFNAKAKASAPSAVITKSEATPPSPAKEKASFSTDEVLLKAAEAQKKRDAAVVKNYVVSMLIDMVIDNPGKDEVPSSSDVDDEFSDDDNDVETIESPHQQLFNLIGEEGFSELKETIQKSLIQTNTSSALGGHFSQAMRARREAIDSVSVDAGRLEKNRDKAPIKDAVSRFIDARQDKGLLAAGKEIKQREDAEAQRTAEAKRIEEARQAEERVRKAAAAKEVEEAKKAAEVQKKLSEMGVKEAVVNTAGVKQAESQKDIAISEANAKKSDAQKLDSFLSSIDDDLAKGLSAVQQAEELRIAALAKAKKEEAQQVKTENVQGAEQTQERVEQAQKHVEQTQERVEQTQERVEQTQERVEQTQKHVEQTQERVEQTIPRPKVQAKMAEPRQPEQPIANAQAAELLKNSGFDRHLKAILTKAEHLEKSKHPTAAAAASEARTIHKILLDNKKEFIAGGKEAQDFVKDCENAIKPEQTKNLAEHRGILGSLQKFVRGIQNVFKSLTSSSPSTYSINTDSMDKVNDMKKSLNKIKEQSTEDNDVERQRRPS